VQDQGKAKYGGIGMVKILVAEDERDIRDLITFTLTFAGYEVIGAANGEEAIEMALAANPDLILMDVRMPRMDGYAACVKMKAEESIKDIPVVFLSAKGQEAEVNTGLQAGAAEYILKPFSPDQLIERVKANLERFGK
jgi:DNA-binding response OmpR family regulator